VKETDYELVMVTNQDGLGTEIFPEEMFWPSHNKMLQILKGEGIEFAGIFIDRTFPEEDAPTRKPGTAMLTKYLAQGIDLNASYVIGDRVTDLQLARILDAALTVKHPCSFKYARLERYLSLSEIRTEKASENVKQRDFSCRGIEPDGSGK
jgi:histidinol-phosphatase